MKKYILKLNKVIPVFTILLIIICVQYYVSKMSFHETARLTSPDRNFDLVEISRDWNETQDNIFYVYIVKTGDGVNLEKNSNSNQVKIAGFYGLKNGFYKDLKVKGVDLFWLSDNEIQLKYLATRFKHIIPKIKFKNREFIINDDQQQ